MFKAHFIIIFCFLSTAIFGQTNPYEKDLIAVYDTIAAATDRGDWDKVLNFTYPKIFKIAPREKMRDLISSTFTDTSVMKFTVIKGHADSLSNDTLQIDNELFVLLYDSKKMQIVMTEALSKPDEDHELLFNMMQTSFETSFGKDNVKLDKAKATFDIVKKKGTNLCSNISPTRDKNSWTMMEVKFENPQLLNMVLSKEVIDWIKKH